jgi:Raf kinase inhibitor-like YbhB/YbcL family protein
VTRAKILGLLAALFAFGLGAQAWAFELSSPDVPANGTVPMKNVFKGFGCTGENVSPGLTWKDPPAGTKSFALTVYDPDAPTGSGWWHWVVFNIPASATAIPAGAGNGGVRKGMPKGSVQSATDFGKPGWGGPCPPQGDQPHHYIFTLYALKTDKLDEANRKSSAAYVGFNIHFTTIDKATFTATFGR